MHILSSAVVIVGNLYISGIIDHFKSITTRKDVLKCSNRLNGTEGWSLFKETAGYFEKHSVKRTVEKLINDNREHFHTCLASMKLERQDE